MIEYKKQEGVFIPISTKYTLRQIEVSSVEYMCCSGYITEIHLIDNQTVYSVSRLLKLFEQELAQYEFLRANRNTLVNAKHITKVEYMRKDTTKENQPKTHFVHLKNKTFNISRRNAHLFRKFNPIIAINNDFLP